MPFFRWLFSANFMPHEYCYLRNPAMIHLHFWSDLLIGMSYVAISLTLVYMVRRARRDIPFRWVFLAFGAFIIACGGTHFMEVWTLWDPVYWLAGCVKAVTAAASVATALILPPLVPRTLDMVRAAKLSDERKADLEAANRRLEAEIVERRRAEGQIRKLAESLEIRVRERTAELARANDELAEKAAIVQHSRDAIIGASLDGAITSWNPAAETLYGYTATAMIGRNAALLESSGAASWRRLSDRLASGEALLPFEARHVRKDGSTVDVLVTISPIRDAHGALRGASLVTRDITERKRSEEQLRQVQKLEGLGLIAGGVAHDFNNLLVGILGNASLVLDTVPPSSPNHRLLEHVIKASEKAAHLTAQLLAYAGKGRFVSRKVDLSSLVREITPLIQSSVPKSVQIRHDLADNLPPVEADPGQLQQVVMNLVINGAEAVGDRAGVVIVTTGVQYADAEYIRQNFAGDPIEPGLYVTLEVHDSGAGMDEAVHARIFDPFFTTKFTGRGLGLSAVMGVVRAHKGTIRVYTEPGRGSTFKILLPAVAGSAESAPSPDADRELHGRGLILVADDEEIVRTTAAAALTRYGYEVITASDGSDAVRQFRCRAAEIALVLLDMTMPVLSGERFPRNPRHPPRCLRRRLQRIQRSGSHSTVHRQRHRRFHPETLSRLRPRPRRPKGPRRSGAIVSALTLRIARRAAGAPAHIGALAAGLSSMSRMPVLTRFALAALLFCLVSPARDLKMRATAYSRHGRTASGAKARRGVIAADPRVLPLGSKVKVKNAGRYSGTYIVGDTGRRIRGRKIDVFIPSRREALRFGKRPVRVRILKRPRRRKRVYLTANHRRGH